MIRTPRLTTSRVRSFASAAASQERVLVVGAGAIGLRTAWELVNIHKIPVVVQAPVPPLDKTTCSMGAGGFWMPFRCDDERVDRWALETLDELQEYAKNSGLVELLPALHVMPGPVAELPSWTQDKRLDFKPITIDSLYDSSGHSSLLKIPPLSDWRESGYEHAWFFQAPIVNSPMMLLHLLDQLNASGLAEVNVETGTYMESIDQMQSTAQVLGCTAVVNCTGLGAAAICNEDDSNESDVAMQGARGVLHIYDRRTICYRTGGTQDALIAVDCEPWGTDSHPCYRITRGNIVIVGGTYLPGDAEKMIRPDEHEQLRENAYKLGIDTKKSRPIGEWVGFRPSRPSVRCEIEEAATESEVKVVHNYGHGGSGWTINVGAARECAELVISAST